MNQKLYPLLSLLLAFTINACSDTIGPPDEVLVSGPSLGKGGKGGGNPGKTGVATVALSGSYATAADQVVGLEKTGKGVAFNAGTSNPIDYTLNLPPYGGDAACGSSGLAAGESAEDLWNDFVATQNVVTSRTFLFNYRFDNKVQENRTRGIWAVDGVRRHFHAGTTNELGLDVNATISVETVDGNDVYTLTGGALQILVATSLQDEKYVTCPNSTGTFVLTVRG